MAVKTPAKKAKKAASKKGINPFPKAEPIELEGKRPLSLLDYQFCQAFVETSSQVDAFRRIHPEAKAAHSRATAMMKRPEIREHIKLIFRKLDQEKERAAAIASQAVMLSLEMADSAISEILQTRRRSLGESLAKDTKDITLLPGVEVTAVAGPRGKAIMVPKMTPELEEQLRAPSFVEDGDKLKAAELTYKRLGGILKVEKPPAPTTVQVMLYQPGWRQRAQATLEKRLELDAG